MKRALLLLTALCIASPTFAEPPLPSKKQDSLGSLQQKVEAEKARQKDLDAQAVTLQKDVGEIKDDLVKTASKVQDSERTLQELEGQMAELKVKKLKMDGQLKGDRKSLSQLIIAMERMRRLPPETLIAKPGAPRETAQAATALSAIVPELNKRAEELRLKLEELAAIETDLTAKQTEAKDTYEKLKAEKTKMDVLLASRNKAYERTNRDLKAQQRVVANVSKEAADFQELIARIEAKNRQQERERAAARESAPRSKRREPDAQALANLPSLGSAQLPVSGIVKVRYGEEDEIGATSQGVRIESRAGAVVVAPMGGTVRYAGPFKAYGNIILLEHKNNYHSLIAGLGRIDTVVGQSVDSGEPVGILGSQSSGGRPSLYYELRLNGQPINPARKFSDLGT